MKQSGMFREVQNYNCCFNKSVLRAFY